jgi:hypothetical protein
MYENSCYNLLCVTGGVKERNLKQGTCVRQRHLDTEVDGNTAAETVVTGERWLLRSALLYFFISFLYMFIGFELCVFIFMPLFSINSEGLFEVAVTDFIAGNAMTHHVLVHPHKDLWHVCTVSHAATVPAATSAFVSTGDSLRSPQTKK